MVINTVDGAALVPSANGGDPTDQDDITVHDSTSQVSLTTSSIRRRKNVLADRVKKEAILEKHRLEKERENLEETESKMKEKVERKKNELRRKEGLAQCNFDIRVLMIKAAEEKEMAEMENEVRKRERGEKERMGPKGDSNAAYLLPPASITADCPSTSSIIFFLHHPFVSSHIISTHLVSSQLPLISSLISLVLYRLLPHLLFAFLRCSHQWRRRTLG